MLRKKGIRPRSREDQAQPPGGEREQCSDGTAARGRFVLFSKNQDCC